MSKILIADDEQLFLKGLVEGLKNRPEMEGIEILTASNGKVAIDLLGSNPDISLVLTDLRMPEVNGFQLISYMTKNHPDIPIIVMTAYGSKELEKTIGEKGIFHYIEKPIDFDELVKKVSSRLTAKRKGTLRGFKLSTLLQIMKMDVISCTLKVSYEGKKGTLFIKKGELINAQLNDLDPMQAALEIVTWEGGKIDIGELGNDVEEKISMGLMKLLFEAFRIKDEKGERGEEARDSPGGQSDVSKEEAQEENLLKEKKEGIEMKLALLNQAIETLKDDLGNGLLATDIFSSKDGQPIAGWNSQPAASALFAQITKMMNKALTDAGFPSLGQYYLLNVEDNKVVLVIYMKDYQWGILMDAEKVPLGMLLNVAMPKAIKKFMEAAAE